jgi:molybdopterin converting factor small subunit
MPNFRIPTPLRPYSGGNSQVTVAGATVGEALNDLTGQYPDLRQHLYDDGQLRSFVNIYLNQEDIRYGDGVETAVAENDTLMIIPSIAGGRGLIG